MFNPVPNPSSSGRAGDGGNRREDQRIPSEEGDNIRSGESTREMTTRCSARVRYRRRCVR